MIEGIPSKTAVGPAVRRAVENAKPEAKRICCDEYAKYFLTPHSTAIGESRIPRWLVNLYLDYWKEIGVGNLVVVRTRYFDEAVLQAKRDGLEQLVILGAGYDSRSYRLIQPEDQIAAYEIDFPATQIHKRSILEKTPGWPFPHVRYVSIDFLSETLEEAIQKSDYSTDRRTFFLWEGVTFYLTEKSVRQTLSFIRTHAAPGSRVVFDYLHFMPQQRSYTRRTWHDREEPLLWGIEPEKIQAFLEEFDFVSIENESAVSAGKRYCREKKIRNRIVSPTFSFVQAVVPK